LVIDRYKYIDLYPCTQGELKSLGYRVSATDLFYNIALKYLAV